MTEPMPEQLPPPEAPEALPEETPAGETPSAAPAEPEGRWGTTEDAAAHYGLSARTIRRRIEAGELRAEKAAGSHAYRVWLEGAPAEPSEEREGEGETHEGHFRELPPDAPPAASSASSAAADAVLAALTRHLDTLVEENRALTRRTEELAAAAAIWQERARTFEERIHALTATAGESPATDAGLITKPADNLATPIVAQPDVSNAPLEPARPWWKRLFGI